MKNILILFIIGFALIPFSIFLNLKYENNYLYVITFTGIVFEITAVALLIKKIFIKH
jgi:hypothetical protein